APGHLAAHGAQVPGPGPGALPPGTGPWRRLSVATIEEQAAEWVLRLGEGELSAGEQAELDAWLLADPRHAATLQRMQGVIRQLQGLRDQRGPAAAALATAQPAPRRVPVARRSLLGLALAAVMLGGLRVGGIEPRDWLADLHTA